MSTVLVTVDLIHADSAVYLDLLRQAGFEVRFQGTLSGEEETVQALEGVAATIAGVEPYTERVVSQLPELRVIARFGVGFDRIDLDGFASQRSVGIEGVGEDAEAGHRIVQAKLDARLSGFVGTNAGVPKKRSKKRVY